MSTKKKSSLQRFDYNRLLLLIIPLAAYFIPGIFLMGVTEALYAARFASTLLIFAVASFPLTVTLFPLSRSGGFTLGKAFGVLFAGLLVWTLAYLQIGRINIVFIILSIVLLAFCSWYPKNLREEAVRFLKKDGSVENIVIEETVFILFFTMLCFYKGMYSDIAGNNGQEKFMDYGFMMSMIRNNTLPANDMWLSGHSINYYYFGQYIYAFLTRLSFVKTSVAYNLSMCCSIALPFAMCYSIGQMLIDGAREFGMRCNRIFAVISGILTGAAVCVFGNSHSFYYDQDSFGSGLLNIFKSWGINVGKTDGFFYPESTRFIGHNPDSATLPGIVNGGDYTIEEFPFYSYLVGDLHAHVCSTMVVLLIFALAISLLSRIYSSNLLTDKSLPLQAGIRKHLLMELQYLLQPEIICIGILLGICQMTNYWDYLIYFIYGSMLLLVVNTYRTKRFTDGIGAVLFVITVGGILGIYLFAAYMPLIHTVLQLTVFVLALITCAKYPGVLTRTSTGMSFLFTASTLVSLPFNYNFEMISNKIAPCVNHSSPYQLFILWGTHVIICVTFVIFVIVFRHQNGKAVYGNPIERFFKERNPMDVLICGSIIVGLLLLVAPEIFYVRDIYTGGYLRSNTMFKFTYAGFIILSICMIYAIMRLMFMTDRENNMSTVAFVVSLIFAAMLLVPAHYTYVSLKQRCGSLDVSNYKSIDGTAYIATYSSPNMNTLYAGNLSDYLACAEWFNSEVEGDPVILEAYGLSYTDNNIISAFTGLPTVCGWQTHEWLWRFHGIVDEETDLLVADPERDVWAHYLTPRHADIDVMYTSNDPNAIRSLLNKYNIEYVIIGDLERSKYSGVDNTGMFCNFGRVVFTSGNLMVVQIWQE